MAKIILSMEGMVLKEKKEKKEKKADAPKADQKGMSGMSGTEAKKADAPAAKKSIRQSWKNGRETCHFFIHNF